MDVLDVVEGKGKAICGFPHGTAGEVTEHVLFLFAYQLETYISYTHT